MRQIVAFARCRTLGKLLQVSLGNAGPTASNKCWCSQGGFSSFTPHSLLLNELKSFRNPSEIHQKSIRNLGTQPWECALRASYLPAPQENPFLRGNLWGGCPLSTPCLSGLQIKGEHPSGLAEPISRYTSFSLGMGHPPRAEILPLATVQVVVGQQKRFVPAGEK